jgi:hypothetical protein
MPNPGRSPKPAATPTRTRAPRLERARARVRAESLARSRKRACARKLGRVLCLLCLLLAAADAPRAQSGAAESQRAAQSRPRRAAGGEGERAEVASLVRALGDRKGQAAGEAAERLIEIGAGAAPALVAALKSGDTQTRLHAALALAVVERGNADALAALSAIVRDKREYYLTRRQAAYAMVRTAAGVRALAPMLKDSDAEARLAAAFAFEELSEGESEDPAGPHAALREVIPALVEALKDRNPVVRGVVGETLGQLGLAAQPYLKEKDEETAGGEAGGAARESGDADDEPEPTPEEEREARSLALLFLARARLSGDLEFAARELLVEDFAERLRGELLGADNFLEDFVDARLVEQSRPEELSRLMWSLVNFIDAASAHLARAGGDNGGRERPTLGEAFPPQVARMIERNRAAAVFVNKMWGIRRTAGVGAARAGDAARGAGAEGVPVAARGEGAAGAGALLGDAAELRAFAEAAEAIAKALREHRAALPASRAAEAKEGGETKAGGQKAGDPAAAQKAGGAAASRVAAPDAPAEPTEDDTAGPPKLLILGETFFGYPPKTRLVCVDVSPAGAGVSVHLDFVRVNGRLRLLTLSPQP